MLASEIAKALCATVRSRTGLSWRAEHSISRSQQFMRSSAFPSLLVQERSHRKNKSRSLRAFNPPVAPSCTASDVSTALPAFHQSPRDLLAHPVLFVFGERGRKVSSNKAVASSGRFFSACVSITDDSNHSSCGIDYDEMNLFQNL
jgi:hypothetical protein